MIDCVFELDMERCIQKICMLLHYFDMFGLVSSNMLKLSQGCIAFSDGT